MIIERITLTDWMPFGGTHALDLPAGPVAVVATYNGQPTRSNWAGKTALLEAIEWALFGVHRKRYEDKLIHRGAAETQVALELTGGITVTRTRKNGKATQLELDEDGQKSRQKKAQERINEILCFDHDDYRETVCFAQGDIEAIAGKTSGKRRETIWQWLELDSWARVAARARSYMGNLNAELEEIRSELRTLEGMVDDHGYPEDLDVVTGDVDHDMAFQIGSFLGSVYGYREHLSWIEDELEKAADVEVLKQDAARFEKLREEAAELKDKIKKANAIHLEELLKSHREEAEKAASDAYQARRERDDAANFQRGNFDGTCPVTRGQCPVADDIRGDVEAGRKRYDVALEAVLDAEKRERDAKDQASKVERISQKLDRDRQRFNSVVEALRELKPRWEKWNETEEDSEERIESLKRRKAEQSKLEREMTKNVVELVQIENAEMNRRDKVARLRKRADDLEEQLRIVSVVTKAVGPGGAPARIADVKMRGLEENANEMLIDVGLSFEFSWDRELREPSPTCRDCGYVYKGKRDKECPACGVKRGLKRADELEILVDDRSGEIEDIREKSGGARVLVASSIRLAAGMMLRELRGAPCAWACIDEPFGPLDGHNRVTLANAFAGMLGAVGLEQAFVVSHDATLLDALPGRIEITRSGNVSTLEVAA